MVALSLSALFGGLRIDGFDITPDGVTLTAHSAAGGALCSHCGRVSPSACIAPTNALHTTAHSSTFHYAYSSTFAVSAAGHPPVLL